MDKLVASSQAVFFSDEQMRRWLGHDIRILTFNQLLRYSSLVEACGEHGVCVLLFETRLPDANGHNGHWVALFRVDETTWEWFDPYGIRPGSERDYIAPDVAQELKEDQPIIEELIARAPEDHRLIYNQVPLQKMQKGIDTCGRWVCVRVLKRHVSLAQFQEQFVGQKESGDWLVTCMTML